MACDHLIEVGEVPGLVGVDPCFAESARPLAVVECVEDLVEQVPSGVELRSDRCKTRERIECHIASSRWVDSYRDYDVVGNSDWRGATGIPSGVAACRVRIEY